MKTVFHRILLGGLFLTLLAAACSPKPPTITAAEQTALAAGATGMPTFPAAQPPVANATGTAPTPLAGQTQPIPVTGGTTASLLCQFCVDEVAHAVLVLPQGTTFSLTGASASPSASTTAPLCNSVEVMNGKQVVICYGPTSSSLTLQVCTGADCSDFQINLDPCPAAQRDAPQVASTPVPPTEEVVPTQPAPTEAAATPTPEVVEPTPTPATPAP